MAAAQPAAAARVFSIDAALPFADALAAGILQRHGGDPGALADVLVLLPTRRAARALREAFLRQSGGKALLLPRFAPLGDVEEDDLLLSEAAGETLDEAIPPAIDGIERLGLLTQLVLQRAHVEGAESWGVATPAQAAALAGELARLLDSLQIEDVAIERLAGLVPERFAQHWKLTLRFLEIISRAWPAILAERGAIDPAARRNALLRRQAALWRAQPPTHTVIAAGSTGSIPATRELLATIAQLPQGAVVLPGLDRHLTEAQWTALEQTHPQYGLRELVAALDLDRAAVADWPAPGIAAAASAGVALWSQALLPGNVDGEDDAPATAPPAKALAGLSRIEAATPQAEATAIALMLRGALETRGRTAALVTADRDLARRVASELRRWDIEVDDSAGTPLLDTPPAVLLRLIGEALENDLAPVPLLALLQHPLCALGLARADLLERARFLDRRILRGPRPAGGIDGLRRAAAGFFDEADAMFATARAETDDLLGRLETALRPLADAMSDDAATVPALARALAQCGEAVAATDESDGAATLWRGEAGEASAVAIGQLIERGESFGAIDGRLWPGLFVELARTQVVRPRRGSHPRLAIWGPLEARLQRADLMILGGLNEGSWPPLVDTGPWLTRPMRQELGLPAPERRIGLAAHDFVQAACAGQVTFTRAERAEGAPTVPARWLARLDALLGRDAEKMPSDLAAGIVWLRWADRIDRPTAIAAAKPPRPTPPLEGRPRRLSVTAIETWRRDPYALYARQILRLPVLDPLDMDPTARDRGTLMHAVLDRFLAEAGGRVRAGDEERLIALGREMFGRLLDRPAERAFWWPRFERVARWFVRVQLERQAEGIVPAATEARGNLVLKPAALPFEIVAKADRIDRLADGTLEIIDYKTGSGPSVDEVAAGYAPQLPLEAMIAAKAPGFASVSGRTARLSYWRLHGIEDGGAIEDMLQAKKLVNAMAEHGGGNEDTAAVLLRLTERSLLERIRRYDDPRTPYLSQPRPSFAGYGDYDHLARVQEWTVRHGDE
ncbi:MAG: double-strand break repair protein AddB [Reyranellaceae bacterium]